MQVYDGAALVLNRWLAKKAGRRNAPSHSLTYGRYGKIAPTFSIEVSVASTNWVRHKLNLPRLCEIVRSECLFGFGPDGQKIQNLARPTTGQSGSVRNDLSIVSGDLLGGVAAIPIRGANLVYRHLFLS